MAINWVTPPLSDYEDYEYHNNIYKRYIGNAEYVEIPANALTVVNGRVSAGHMFRGTAVKGVKAPAALGIQDMTSMFRSTTSIALNVDEVDTSSAIIMTSMFRESAARVLDLFSFDTQLTESMDNMFDGAQCEILNVSSFVTSRVKNMAATFSNMVNIIDLDIAHLITSSVETMAFMFNYCPLRSIDISGFDFANTTNMTNMFQGTLARRVYVGSQAAKDKLETLPTNTPAHVKFEIKLVDWYRWKLRYDDNTEYTTTPQLL